MANANWGGHRTIFQCFSAGCGCDWIHSFCQRVDSAVDALTESGLDCDACIDQRIKLPRDIHTGQCSSLLLVGKMTYYATHVGAVPR